MPTPSLSKEAADISVRPMLEADLVEARRIFRVAFGTFLGVPNPEDFWADREYVFTRWRTDPDATLAAELHGSLAGSNFATNWGSFGFFGPLTVRPEFWDQRVAQKLLAPTMDLFSKWGVREAGLFTFAHSPKHVGLYQKFGFWPRFLTAIMSKRAEARKAAALKFSSLTEADQDHAISACGGVTDSIYEGLDVTCEINAVRAQNLGETLLLWDRDSLEGFAVCHCGEGTEAGRDTCFVKFAAVRPGTDAENAFERLLDACESLASERGLSRLEAGVNLSRSKAYSNMLRRGFRTDIQGVAMHRPDSPAYNRSDIFVIDDWR
ncbi:MAG: GNAT family N-acetyltransferase [Acidobacteriaceae bacterium]|nr:GNAT family N-acetyltransferase [Acidobacteriaceae bacterium]